MGAARTRFAHQAIRDDRYQIGIKQMPTVGRCPLPNKELRNSCLASTRRICISRGIARSLLLSGSINTAMRASEQSCVE